MEDLMGYQTNINNATGDLENIQNSSPQLNNFVAGAFGGKEKYGTAEALGFSNLDYERNALEAAKSRNWQEYMSNTEIQRRAKDLEAVGFSPMALLSSVSGASTPSGATASSSSSAGNKQGGGSLLDLVKTVGMLMMAGAKLGATREIAAGKLAADARKIESINYKNEKVGDWYNWLVTHRRHR